MPAARLRGSTTGRATKSRPWAFLAAALVVALLALGVAGCVEEVGVGNPPQPPPYSAPAAPAQPRSPASISIGSALAEPGPTPTPFFANYWGVATLDGAKVPVGAVVEAFTPRGELAGRFRVNTAGYFGYMRVYGEDPTSTPPIPGMRAGEALTFKVDGKLAMSIPSPAVWQSSLDPAQIDLEASSSAAEPTAAAPPGATRPPVGSPAGGIAATPAGTASPAAPGTGSAPATPMPGSRAGS